MQKTGVFLVGEQVLIRRALASLILSHSDYNVAGEFSSCSEAIEYIKGFDKYIYFVDAELPGSDIRELVSAVKVKAGSVIIFGSVYNKRKLAELVSLKADGYFPSNLTEADFFMLLGKVKNGTRAIADSLIPEIVDVLSARIDNTELKKLFLLTPREKEILKLLAEGYTNDRIARKLVISVYTVKNHVHNMLAKMDIENRAQLVCYAFNSGLVNGQAG